MTTSPAKPARGHRDLSNYPLNMHPAQVAEFLNCADRHVRDLVDEGLLEASDISSSGSSRKALRVVRASVERFLIARKVV